MAGNGRSPITTISLSYMTPVVVSSLTPLHFAAILVYLVLSAGMEFLSRAGGCTCPCGSRGQHHHRRSQAGHSHPGLAQSSSALCTTNTLGESRPSCKVRRGAGLRDGCCSMVLSAEGVERAPTNFGTERCDGLLSEWPCAKSH